MRYLKSASFNDTSVICIRRQRFKPQLYVQKIRATFDSAIYVFKSMFYSNSLIVKQQ
jgi:hypothetical protein